MVGGTPAVPALAERYRLDRSDEWQKVLTHFELSEGFAFIVLLVPDSDGALACRQALERHLHLLGKSLCPEVFGALDELNSLASQLLKLEPPAGTGAVWVQGMVSADETNDTLWKEIWREAAARLNQFRNPLQRQFNIPLLFVGKPWLQEVLREMSPDLWSIRTLVARVEPPLRRDSSSPIATTPARWMLDSFGSGAHPDPEYALQQAERLRSRPDRRRELARLLHRAGLGFMARYQWAQAANTLSEAADLRAEQEPASTFLAEVLYELGVALTWLTDYTAAQVNLEHACEIYHESRDLLGEANCIQRLGEIALRRSDHDQARQRYEEALRLYGRIPEPFSIGTVHQRLARLASNEIERQQHINFARSAWESINRPELVLQLDEEFGHSE